MKACITIRTFVLCGDFYAFFVEKFHIETQCINEAQRLAINHNSVAYSIYSLKVFCAEHKHTVLANMKCFFIQYIILIMENQNRSLKNSNLKVFNGYNDDNVFHTITY